MIQSGVMGEKRNKPKASISVFLEGPHDLQIACLLWVKDCALEGYLQIHQKFFCRFFHCLESGIGVLDILVNPYVRIKILTHLQGCLKGRASPSHLHSYTFNLVSSHLFRGCVTKKKADRNLKKLMHQFINSSQIPTSLPKILSLYLFTPLQLLKYIHTVSLGVPYFNQTNFYIEIFLQRLLDQHSPDSLITPLWSYTDPVVTTQTQRIFLTTYPEM